MRQLFIQMKDQIENFINGYRNQHPEISKSENDTLERLNDIVYDLQIFLKNASEEKFNTTNYAGMIMRIAKTPRFTQYVEVSTTSGLFSKTRNEKRYTLQLPTALQALTSLLEQLPDYQALKKTEEDAALKEREKKYQEQAQQLERFNAQKEEVQKYINGHLSSPLKTLSAVEALRKVGDILQLDGLLMLKLEESMAKSTVPTKKIPEKYLPRAELRGKTLKEAKKLFEQHSDWGRDYDLLKLNSIVSEAMVVLIVKLAKMSEKFPYAEKTLNDTIFQLLLAYNQPWSVKVNIVKAVEMEGPNWLDFCDKVENEFNQYSDKTPLNKLHFVRDNFANLFYTGHLLKKDKERQHKMSEASFGQDSAAPTPVAGTPGHQSMNTSFMSTK